MLGRRRLLRWALAAAGAGVGLTGLLTFGAITAVLGASIATCTANTEATAAGGREPPSAAAVGQIPPERLTLYEQAASRFNIDWSFLASIGAQECGQGLCSGVNGSGCAGPMQIAYIRESACSPGPGSTLWERYAVDADPSQPLSVNDLADAIFTAARILHEDMGAPPAGGSYQAYYQAACRYYGACADASVSYASEVMARAVLYGFTGPGTPTTSAPLAQPVAAQRTSGCSSVMFTSGATGEQRIVAVAESQVGQAEHPPGSNCTIYGPCEQWCSLFAAWVWQHAGIDLPGATAAYGYSGALYTWVQQHRGTILPPTAIPARGDLIFYGHGPDASVHVGIVVNVLPSGAIETIEGNYANQVSRVGPFNPAEATSIAGEAGPVYGYAQPPTLRSVS